MVLVGGLRHPPAEHTVVVAPVDDRCELQAPVALYSVELLFVANALVFEALSQPVA